MQFCELSCDPFLFAAICLASRFKMRLFFVYLIHQLTMAALEMILQMTYRLCWSKVDSWKFVFLHIVMYLRRVDIKFPKVVPIHWSRFEFRHDRSPCKRMWGGLSIGAISFSFKEVSTLSSCLLSSISLICLEMLLIRDWKWSGMKWFEFKWIEMEWSELGCAWMHWLSMIDINLVNMSHKYCRLYKMDNWPPRVSTDGISSTNFSDWLIPALVMFSVNSRHLPQRASRRHNTWTYMIVNTVMELAVVRRQSGLCRDNLMRLRDGNTTETDWKAFGTKYILLRVWVIRYTLMSFWMVHTCYFCTLRMTLVRSKILAKVSAGANNEGWCWTRWCSRWKKSYQVSLVFWELV